MPATNLEMDYLLLKVLEAEPSLSQRAIARQLGISLGKANYCLKALIDAGMVKVDNFQQSCNKTGYVYLLTPKGIKRKSIVARMFLEKKIKEYEQLQVEIEGLKKDVGNRNK